MIANVHFVQGYKAVLAQRACRVLDTWKPLDFYGTDSDLRVQVSDISPPWKLSEGSSALAVRKFSFSDVLYM